MPLRALQERVVPKSMLAYTDKMETDCPGVGPETVENTAPVPGWSPYSLGKDSWGSWWRGDTHQSPADLVGYPIEVTTRGARL